MIYSEKNNANQNEEIMQLILYPICLTLTFILIVSIIK